MSAHATPLIGIVAHCPLSLQGPSFDPMLHELQCLPMTFDGNMLEEVAEARTGVLEVCWKRDSAVGLTALQKQLTCPSAGQLSANRPCCHDGLQL